ncbi:MAG: hypothetical protein NC336_00390 [Clostridium sp.]|nr:hypothetical protein [Clostridium sp.]
MKKALLIGIIVMPVGLSIRWHTINSKEPLSALELSNIEALSDDESILAGDPCYSDGVYDIGYPEVVVCGNPCYRQKTRLPLFPSKSYCE